MKSKLLLVLALLCLPAFGQQAVLTLNATSATTAGNFPAAGTISLIGGGVAYENVTWNVAGGTPTCTVTIDSSPDGTTWSVGGILGSTNCASNGQSALKNVVANYARINPTIVGAGTITFVLNGYTNGPIATGSANNIFTGALSAASFGSCSVLDFALCASAVDASGNPSFIAQGSAGNKLTITGTGLIAYIQGVYQTGTGTYTDAITGLGSSTFNYVYVKQDTANANLALADFAATILAPVYSYKAPGACTGATASAPQYWFDLSTYQWKVSTAAACSFSVASPQVLFLGVVWVTVTPTISGVAHEPFSLSPRRRYELFGDGFDVQNAGTDITKQERTSGTLTIDTFHSYTSFEVTGGTVNHTAQSSAAQSMGVAVSSQNPVIIVNTSTVGGVGLGRSGPAGGIGAAAAASTAGSGGGGGGGGAASVTNAGGPGATRNQFAGTSLTCATTVGGAGGVVGGAVPTTGCPANTANPDFRYVAALFCSGNPGGAGGGDTTNASGGGGTAGGMVIIRAPSIVEDASSIVRSNAGVGGNAAGAGNSGGGGGGGGGCAFLLGGYVITSGTFTASGGAGGSGFGAGQAGATGGAGIAQAIKLF